MSTHKNKIKDKIIMALRKHGVLKAALFGSFVRGDAKIKSDIDILVKFKPGKSLLDLVGLKLDLEKLLKRRVDIVTYDSLHPLLRRKILKEQEVLL